MFISLTLTVYLCVNLQALLGSFTSGSDGFCVVLYIRSGRIHVEQLRSVIRIKSGKQKGNSKRPKKARVCIIFWIFNIVQHLNMLAVSRYSILNKCLTSGLRFTKFYCLSFLFSKFFTGKSQSGIEF